MLVFQGPENILSLLSVHTIATQICDIPFFLRRIAAHSSIQVKTYATLDGSDTFPECHTLHKTQFFKESLEIKFKAFHRHAFFKATFVLQKQE